MRNLFILFLLLSIGNIYGQDNFKRGYIITNEKDTIDGWIDFRTDEQNMRACKFKTEEIGKVTTYLPGEIFGYRFYKEGKFYITKEITINELQHTVFIEYLLQGMMNLFYYIDNSKMNYYFFENEECIITPVTKKPDEYIKVEDSRAKVLKDNRYMGVIGYLFKDQETISKQANKLKFNQKSMINIAKEYHDLVCTTGEECITFETKEDKEYNLLKYSVYGGVQLYKYTNIMEENISIISPIIGVRLNIYAPRISKNLSFLVDLAFSKINKKDYFINSKIYMPVQIGVNHSYGKNKFRPTIEGGLKFPFYSLEKSESNSHYYGFNATFVDIFGSLGFKYILNEKHSIFFNAGYASSGLNKRPDNDIILTSKLGVTF